MNATTIIPKRSMITHRVLPLTILSCLLAGADVLHAQLALKCAPDKTVECGSSWSFDTPTVLGACCPNVLLTFNTTSNLGPCVSTWYRTWYATDCCTSNVTCSQKVTVRDTTPPVLFCTNLTFNCTQPGGTYPVFSVSAYDACDPSPTLTYSPPSGSFFPVGSTFVTVTATDDCGLSNSCVFKLTVKNDCPTDCLELVCPTNLLAYACLSNGAFVSYSISATNRCNPEDLKLVCTPPPGSWFEIGSTVVNCWAIGSGQSNHCSFTVMVVSNCPPSCLRIVRCEAPPRLPCASVLGTPVTWEFEAVNDCNPGHVVTWSDPESGSLFAPGFTPVTCYASNTLSGEVITCNFLVEIFVPLPRIGISGLGGLGIGWTERCDDFGLEWSPSLTPPAWSPVSGLPFSRWTIPNSGDTGNYARLPLPVPPGDPTIGYFRLTDLPAVQQHFNNLPPGPFTNPPGNGTPMFHFTSMDGNQLQVINLNNLNVLAIDGSTKFAFMPSNRVAWPNLLSGSPNLHSVEVSVGLSPNNLPTQFANVKAIDSMGNIVGEGRYTNVNYEALTFSSRGWPLDRLEFTMPNGGLGGLGRLTATPRPPPPGPPACTDFRGQPLGDVPNPWVTTHCVLTARDSNNVAYANGSIVDGPEGHGYHVQYSVEISFTNSTCCVATYVELAQNSGQVDLNAYDPAGNLIGGYRVTNDQPNPVTLYFPPSSAPTCRIVVTSPGDQARILRICCVRPWP